MIASVVGVGASYADKVLVGDSDNVVLGIWRYAGVSGNGEK